ncbi:hypothetical protein [Confluentibacter flavum]|uniref:Dihydroorotase n=1 Tax=Confluentibacter flavum TaxID=1909700 RepID=A0A2N3HNP0_9FLAO|nr:hypothetical protein [Confluentibacter flavum]PKQ46565.1 hypothetical protein CSW08_02040 [Confluentibacter flavum]
MRKICYLLFFVVGLSFANNNPLPNQNEPQVGDVLVINTPSGSEYNHIFFPKLNMIAKRGRVANYKSVHGNHVVVKEVITKSNGNTYVILEKKDNTQFFGFVKKVRANYEKSLNAGEISIANQ